MCRRGGIAALVFPLLVFVQHPVKCTPVPAERVNANLLAGRILRQGGKEAAGGVTVRLYHITSRRQFSTVTAMDSGAFILAELPDGSYELSVQTLGGTFHGADMLTLSGGMRVRTAFVLSNETLPEDVRERLARQGLEPVPTHGVIRVAGERPADAVARHRGRATAWVLGSVGTGYVLYELTEDEEVSGSAP